jgi:hypothetical protein
MGLTADTHCQPVTFQPRLLYERPRPCSPRTLHALQLKQILIHHLRPAVDTRQHSPHTETAATHPISQSPPPVPHAGRGLMYMCCMHSTPLPLAPSRVCCSNAKECFTHKLYSRARGIHIRHKSARQQTQTATVTARSIWSKACVRLLYVWPRLCSPDAPHASTARAYTHIHHLQTAEARQHNPHTETAATHPVRHRHLHVFTATPQQCQGLRYVCSVFGHAPVRLMHLTPLQLEQILIITYSLQKHASTIHTQTAATHPISQSPPPLPHAGRGLMYMCCMHSTPLPLVPSRLCNSNAKECFTHRLHKRVNTGYTQ